MNALRDGRGVSLPAVKIAGFLKYPVDTKAWLSHSRAGPARRQIRCLS